MLRQEVAEKKLEEQKIKSWEKKRVTALSALPAALKKAGLGLLDKDAGGKAFRDWTKRHEAREQAGEALAKATAADRLRVFGALFPKLAPHIEGAWQLLARLPYE